MRFYEAPQGLKRVGLLVLLRNCFKQPTTDDEDKLVPGPTSRHVESLRAEQKLLQVADDVPRAAVDLHRVVTIPYVVLDRQLVAQLHPQLIEVRNLQIRP